MMLKFFELIPIICGSKIAANRLVCCLLGFFLVVFLGAVTPLSISAQSEAYHLGPRDIVSLKIYAGGEMQQEVDLTVSASGEINVPFVGAVKAEGLTTNDLEKIIEKPLREDYFVDPQVNIVIKEYHSLHYYISGAVKTPGGYEMDSHISLLELIAKAGGAIPERGNVAYILRGKNQEPESSVDAEKIIANNEPLKVDLKCLLDKGDMRCNPQLKSGDVVYIPLEKTQNPTESKVFVEGAVKKPGALNFQPGLTALNACIMAGGFDQFAAPNRTRVIRKNGKSQKVIKINLNKVKDGKINDLILKPGDRIHIPETWL